VGDRFFAEIVNVVDKEERGKRKEEREETEWGGFDSNFVECVIL